MEIQVFPLRRLGKGLPGHPVRLYIQRIDLCRCRIQPHGQITAAVHFHPCLFLKAGQHFLIDLIYRLHTAPSLLCQVQLDGEERPPPFQLRPQDGPAQAVLCELRPQHRQIPLLGQSLCDILQGQSLPG